MKKTVLLRISLLMILVVLLSACSIPFVTVERGSGTLTSAMREVQDFNAIQLDGAGRLVITQGSTESLEIEAEDNIIDELTVDVLGKKLVLGFVERPWRKTILPTRAITYYLTVKDLVEVTFNGAGDLEMDSLESPSLEVTFNGAGQMKIDDLITDSVKVNISGTGTIVLSGQADAQTVIIDGAGNYQTEDLQTNTSMIEINGLGNATVWAMESLDITINGGGTVNYYGSPNVTQDITGLGNVNNRGDK